MLTEESNKKSSAAAGDTAGPQNTAASGNAAVSKSASLKKLLRAVIFVAGLAVMLVWLSAVFRYKNSDKRFIPFFEQGGDYDVLFFGTSHVIDAVLPLELWDEYGIVSYNFGGYGMHLPTTFWLIENVLDYASPKLILIDCSNVSSEVMSNTTVRQAHNTWDAFPLTRNKLRAFQDLLAPEDILEFTWKFSIYHDRWEELTWEDFEPVYSIGRGAVPQREVAVPDPFIPIADSRKSDDGTAGARYLRRAIELCQSRGIEVVLTYLPFPAPAYRQKEANLAADIAAEYGVEYINFLKMDGIVNYNTDCNDAASHLNLSGAHKITSWLGNYMRENYGLADHRGEEIYAAWDTDYALQVLDNQSYILLQKTLDAYLMLLSDKNTSSCIYIRKGSGLLQDFRTIELLNNVSVHDYPSELSAAIETGEEYFLFVDNLSGRLWEGVGGEAAVTAETSFAGVRYELTEKGSHTLFVNSAEYPVGANASSADIQLIVIDNRNGNIIDTASFVIDRTSLHLKATRSSKGSTAVKSDDD
ncbi:MAG: hypothetical protein K2N94_01855 [Lachnospiraceae bacterium]|nr:hypothetical protein [Lachnospiraceae bacterium]